MKPKGSYRLWLMLMLMVLALAGTRSGSEDVGEQRSADKLVVDYFTNIPTGTVGAYIYGSQQGGIVLYVHGAGFDATPSHNQVSLCSIPCVVIEGGASNNVLTCITGKVPAGSPYSMQCNVKVTVGTKSADSQSGSFSYYSWSTPEINGLIPRNPIAGQVAAFFGNHYVTNVENITKLSIGDFSCSPFNLSANSGVYPYYATPVYCVVDPLQPAGFYNTTELNTMGYAKTNPYILSSHWGKNLVYSAMVQPAISNLSENVGSSQAHKLTINGSGFGTNKQQVDVRVAGSLCPINTIQANSITCTVRSANAEGQVLPNLGRLPTNTNNTQVNEFVSGVGASFKRYTGTERLTDRSIQGFINGTASGLLTLEETGTLGSLEVNGTAMGSIYHFKSYFKAPKNGSYTFRIYSNDRVFMLMSPFKGSAEVNYSNPIIFHNSTLDGGNTSTDPTKNSSTNAANGTSGGMAQGSSTNMFLNDLPNNLTSTPIVMTVGDYYYFEIIYAITTYGSFMKTSVEIPNDDPSILHMNSRPEIQKLSIRTQTDPEILKFTQTGANNGTMNILLKITYKYLDYWSSEWYYGSTVTYNASAEEFTRAISNFGATPNVTREVFDENGDDPTVSGLAPYKWVWTVTTYSYRYYQFDTYGTENMTTVATNLSNTVDSSVTPTFEMEKVQDRSPLITGNYSLSLGGYGVSTCGSSTTQNSTCFEIPFSVDPTSLQGYIKQSWGCDTVNVINADSTYNPRLQITYLISLRGCVGLPPNLPIIVGDASKLEGGSSGSPELTITELQYGSSNVLIEPLSPEFLFVPDSKSQVLVTVNDIIASCQTNCSFSFTPILPSITKAVLTTTNSLNVTLAYNGTTSAYQLKDFSVTLGDVPCVNITGSITNVICAFPKNSDGSLQVKAGNFTPEVMIAKTGAAKPLANLTKILIPLKLTSFTPNTTGQVGGISMILKGSGYPMNLSDASGFNVTMCGQQVPINWVNSTNINITVAECVNLSTTITVAYNLATASLAFNYDPTMIPPTINAITPASASPVLKASMNITGVRFGTNRSEITVWLVKNTTRVYQLNVLKINDTQMLVRIPGGLPGTFRVVVSRIGYGNSKENTVGAATFVYEIGVTSISPLTGSINGGTIITITGNNFSPDPTDNQVFIGSAVNWFCEIITSSATQIQCRTPPIHPSETALNQTVDVYGRITVQANCTGSCVFTYDNSTYPTVVVPSYLYFNANQNITLNGTRFVAGGVLPTVWVGTVQATVLSANNTSVRFTYPALRKGQYPIRVYVSGVGYASPDIVSQTGFSANSLSHTSGSTRGNIIEIRGNALHSQEDNEFSVRITKSGSSDETPYEIVYDTPTALGLRIMDGEDQASYGIQYSTTNYFTYYTNATTTPVVTLSGSKTINHSASGLNLTFVRLNTSIAPTAVEAYQINGDDQRYDSNILLSILSTSTVNGNFVVNATLLTAGKWRFLINFTSYGYAKIDDVLEILPSSAPTASVVGSSYAGGNNFIVNGAGLNSKSKLKIDGKEAELLSASSTQLVYKVPSYDSKTNKNKHSYGESKRAKGKVMADTPKSQAKINDDKTETAYESASTGDCWVGLDLGVGYKRTLFRIKYFVNRKTIDPAQLIGAVFEGSTDNVTYKAIAIIDGNVHRGWNDWSTKNPLSTIYRYLRMRHNTSSNCKVSELVFYDAVMKETSSSTSYKVDAEFSDGVHTTVWNQSVDYRDDATPNVTAVSPQTISPKGGLNVTINGTNFGTNVTAVSVKIDGIDCVVATVSSTKIICTAGAKLAITADTSFDIWVGGKLATVACRNVSYVYRWSDPDTWGGDFPPIEGDAVYIPQGMVLMVDQSTPKVKIIIVEGSLIFADESEITLQAEMIMINYGSFQIGTEDYPYMNKLTIILYGGYYDRQLPVFGNKVIGCHACQFDIHGKPRTRTWSDLNSTIPVGATTLKLVDAVDWVVGEQIVVASTNYSHTEAERKFITAIDSTGKIVTVDSPFTYSHVGVIETLDNDTITIRAEVGLLSRNVVIKGAEDTSGKAYGGHILMHGTADDGLQTRIEYAEIATCGQGSVVGRYCIFYQQNGDLRDCYLRGNSFHDSYSGFIVLQASSNLAISWNVGHLSQGHNFEMTDGTETGHIIEYNLMMGATRSWYITELPTTFMIRNPSNVFRWNRAAGSEAYGVQYMLDDVTDGLDATSEICPSGSAIGELSNTVVHSNGNVGLRITNLISRARPCGPISQAGLSNIYSINPSISNNITNMTIYKNADKGFLAQELGASVFTNFTVVDNGNYGIMFLNTDHSNTNVTLQNAILVGSSYTNAGNTSSYGLTIPYTNGFKVSGITFYRFFGGSALGISPQTSLMYDSYCTFTEKVRFSNIQSQYMTRDSFRRDIIHDLDGSLAKFFFDGQTVPSNFTSGVLVPSYEISAISERCYTQYSSKWGGSVICNSFSKPRAVILYNVQPYSVNWYPIMFMRVRPADNFALSGSAGWNSMVSQETGNHWAVNLVSNTTYEVRVAYSLNWMNLYVKASKFMVNDAQPAIVLRFAYTESRQLFDILKIANGVSGSLIVEQTSPLNTSTCIAGDFYQNRSAGYVDVCITSRDKPLTTSISLTGVVCRRFCPIPLPPDNTNNGGGGGGGGGGGDGGGDGHYSPDGNVCIKEQFMRIWSNVTQWPRGTLPLDGDNVTISCNWTITMDVDPALIDVLEINGNVIIDERDTVISANNIWIRAGSLRAGNSTDPFGYKLDIIITGQHSDSTIAIDPVTAVRKSLIVTGSLYLNGTAPATTQTRLLSKAAAGDTAIAVESVQDWTVGDELLIAPSFSNAYQYERVIITAINGSLVNISSPLNYTHYGDTSPITTSIGTLDMRATVSHLTRKIRIMRGNDTEKWGFRATVYSFQDGSVLRTGRAVLKGVQFIEGGQAQTQNSAIEFINTANEERDSIISGCSFVECGSYCLKTSKAVNVTVTNNVFHAGRKYAVKVDSTTKFNFSSNVIVGVLPRPSMMNFLNETTACFIHSAQPDFLNSQIVVENNICQGSSGFGFIFPFVPCSYIGNRTRFINNEVGSSKIGFLYNWAGGQGNCVNASKLTAYSCELGFMANPSSTNVLKYDQFTLADNVRSIGFKHGFGALLHENLTALFTNSWVSALARPSCDYCYGDSATDCLNNEGVRMMVSTSNGETLLNGYDYNFDHIDKLAGLDSKAFFVNVTFDNFRQNYTGLPNCGNNVIFKPHPQALEQTGSHHLISSTCNNCEQSALGYFSAPPALLTDSLGCGNFACTGLNNYIIQDHTGGFLGFNGTLLANNSWIGAGQANCTYDSKINGYVCNRSDFAVLEYESVAKDYNTRIVWPIELSYAGGNWTSVTNGWRSWDKSGTESANRRLGRFVSTVVLGKVYNMSFNSQPPSDMRFQLQKKTLDGNTTDWVVIYIYYPIANFIAVSVNKVVIEPILATSNETVDNRTAICGANKYFSDNGTISFVVTGAKNCQVRLSVTNNIQISTKIQTTVQEFFNKGGVTKFVDRMCAFLNITTDRLKVVGVFAGSVNIDAIILENTLISTDTNNADNTNTTVDPNKSQSQLTAISQQFNSATTSLDLDGLGTVLSVSSVVNIVNADGTPYTPPEIVLPDQVKSTVILIAIIFSSIIGAVLLGLGIFFLVRKFKKVNNMVHDLEMVEKEKDPSPAHEDKDHIFAEYVPDVTMDRIELKDDSPPRKSSPRRRIKRARE